MVVVVLYSSTGFKRSTGTYGVWQGFSPFSNSTRNASKVVNSRYVGFTVSTGVGSNDTFVSAAATCCTCLYNHCAVCSHFLQSWVKAVCAGSGLGVAVTLLIYRVHCGTTVLHHFKVVCCTLAGRQVIALVVMQECGRDHC